MALSGRGGQTHRITDSVPVQYEEAPHGTRQGNVVADLDAYFRVAHPPCEPPSSGSLCGLHRRRHSAITVYLVASNGDIRGAQKLNRYSQLETLMI